MHFLDVFTLQVAVGGWKCTLSCAQIILTLFDINKMYLDFFVANVEAIMRWNHTQFDKFEMC